MLQSAGAADGELTRLWALPKGSNWLDLHFIVWVIVRAVCRPP